MKKLHVFLAIVVLGLITFLITNKEPKTIDNLSRKEMVKALRATVENDELRKFTYNCIGYNSFYLSKIDEGGTPRIDLHTHSIEVSSVPGLFSFGESILIELKNNGSIERYYYKDKSGYKRHYHRSLPKEKRMEMEELLDNQLRKILKDFEKEASCNIVDYI